MAKKAEIDRSYLDAINDMDALRRKLKKEDPSFHLGEALFPTYATRKALADLSKVNNLEELRALIQAEAKKQGDV
jgi:hypothetical protein